MARHGAEGEHHVYHDSRRLPLTRRDTGVEMGRSRLKERLPHVGPEPAAALHSDPMLFAHSI